MNLSFFKVLILFYLVYRITHTQENKHYEMYAPCWITFETETCIGSKNTCG